MQEGTVKFYNTKKGFGFIKPNDGGDDIFVHATGLINNINENDKVTFEVVKDKKGLSAVNVRLAQ
ncbi:MAG: cold-shock protein [Chitinophagaceae bacterium]|nr:cold-shock protein [Chitinophagaceae bacterium]